MCERELETEQNCNILTTHAPPDIAMCCSRSTGLLNWGPSLSGTCSHPSIFSPTGLQTIWLHVLTELYNSSIAHSISFEWHVWSSSSGNNCHAVHRSFSFGASVYDCTLGFLPIIAIWMCHFLPVPHFGMACLVESKVNIQQLFHIIKTKAFFLGMV